MLLLSLLLFLHNLTGSSLGRHSRRSRRRFFVADVPTTFATFVLALHRQVRDAVYFQTFTSLAWYIIVLTCIIIVIIIVVVVVVVVVVSDTFHLGFVTSHARHNNYFVVEIQD
jgi:hypothetical protein